MNDGACTLQPRSLTISTSVGTIFTLWCQTWRKTTTVVKKLHFRILTFCLLRHTSLEIGLFAKLQ